MIPIKNFEEYQINKAGKIIGKKGTTLKVSNKLRYPAVNLFISGKRHRKYIHRLVLETFIGPCPNGMEANHKDGDKFNPNIENLEWVTKSENEKHAFKLGLKNNKGENCSKAKLKESEVLLIKKLLKYGYVSQRYIAKMFKVSQSAICDINRKRRWSHL